MSEPVAINEEAASAAKPDKNNEQVNGRARIPGGDDLHISWIVVYARQVA